MDSNKRQNTPQNYLLNRFNSILICILLSSLILSCVSKKKIPENDILGHAPKKVRNIFKDFRFVDSGRITIGSSYYIKPNENDSTLLVSDYEYRTHVPSLYISDHEVTNAEYREFTNWVTDSIALSLIANINPSYYLDKDKKILNWNKRDSIWTPVNSNFLTILDDTTSYRYYRKQINKNKIIYQYDGVQNNITIAVYPNTLIWETEFSYAFNDPFTRNYYNFEKYNDYPVVGVSWEQANAYCHWKTDRLKETISKSKFDQSLKINFRLPTELEWENAAYSYLRIINENIDTKKIYPWYGFRLFDNKGKYLANFGAIYDHNMLNIKLHSDDGGFYTTKTKSYTPNNFNIYDMAGNVAEWTSDKPIRETQLVNEYQKSSNIYDLLINNTIEYKFSDSIKLKLLDICNLYKIKETDSLQSAINKIKSIIEFCNKFNMWSGRNKIDPTDDKDLPLIKMIAELQLHDAKVLAAHPNLRIVKGGSWATGPAYMLVSSREVFPENKCSSRIGFRVVLDIGK